MNIPTSAKRLSLLLALALTAFAALSRATAQEPPSATRDASSALAKSPFNIDASDSTPIFLPPNANTCIAFWEDGRGRVATFDTRTGKLITTTQEPMSLNKGVLISQDGKLLANPPRFGSPGVEVWNLATTTKLATLSLNQGETLLIDFLPDGKLLLARKFNQDRSWTLQLWDYRSKELLHSLPLQEDFTLKAAAADPSGKTIICVGSAPQDKPALYLIDAQSLQPITRTFKPKSPRPASTTASTTPQPQSRASTPPSDPASTLGAAVVCRFSPDSRKLAVAFARPGQSSSSASLDTVVFDVESGAQTAFISASPGHSWNRIDMDGKMRAAIQWSQDGARLLLFGDQLFDIATATLLHRLPYRNTGYRSDGFPGILVGNDHYIRAVGFTKRNSNDSIKFEGARLPTDKIARILQSVNAGGDAIDGLLPPLKPFDASSLTPIKPAGTPMGPIEPDPATPVKLMTKPQTHIELRKLENASNPQYSQNTQSNPGILFPHLPSDRALVYGPLASNADEEKVRPISLINTANGFTLNQTIDTSAGVPHALSPDGKRLVLLSRRKQGHRLDVYELSSGPVPPKHLVAWVPSTSSAWSWCEFIDNDTLLTQVDSDLVAVRLPDAQPLYKIADAYLPVLSPAGKQVFFRSGSRIYCASTATGQMIADISGPPANDAGQELTPQLAISPDGKELSILRGSGHMIVTLHTYPLDVQRKSASDTRKLDFYEPTFTKFGTSQFQVQPVKYLAPGHLLLPSGLMVQTAQGVPVIYYNFLGQCAALAMGRYWNVTWDSRAGKYAMDWVQVPSANVLNLSSRFNREDFILYTTPLSANIEFSPPGQHANLKDAVIARLAEIGIQAKPQGQSPLTFKIWGNIEDDPSLRYYASTSHFSFWGPPPGTPTVAAKRMVGHSQLLRDGKVIWSGDAVTYGAVPGYVPQGQTLEGIIEKAAWEAYPGTIMSTTSNLPAMLMDYTRIEKVTLGGTAVETKSAGEGLTELSDDAKETLKDELKTLKRYKIDADFWLADAQALQTTLAAGKMDIKKFRTTADSLANLKRLSVPTEVMAESTRQKLVNIKDAASKATKDFQAAYIAFAAQQAGRRTQQSPDTLLSNAKSALEKTVTPGLQDIANRIKELEEKTK